MPADKLFGKDVTITTNFLNLASTTPPPAPTNICSHGAPVPDAKKPATT